ncbi:MAG: Tetratricopeptide repeat [Blastocatellia bacterium]|nr:Tetratricopeptide repeat [Blastocatellia bacterium]
MLRLTLITAAHGDSALHRSARGVSPAQLAFVMNTRSAALATHAAAFAARAAALAVTLLLLLSASTVARAQQGHSIRGKAHNEQGINLARVSIDLQTGNGSLIAQTVTNNEGDFFFGGLGGNSYIVVASAPDYTVVSERVDFVRRVTGDEPGESRTVDLTLLPKIAPRAPAPGTTFVQDVPTAARNTLTRALRLSKEGKGELALALMQEALKIFPDYFDARFALGNELLKANRLSAAIAELEQARRINPKDGRVYETFGLVLMRQQKHGLAAAVFAEAARLSPLDPQPLLLRAMSLIDYASSLGGAALNLEQERRAALLDAEQNLTRAFELSGRKLTAVYLQRARIYEKRGELATAAAELERYLQESPQAANADAIRQAIKQLRDADTRRKPNERP